jgi:hypothetical protein
MVPLPRTPLRVDRLRALNEPQLVTVELDESGEPVTAGRPDGQTAKIECVNETWRIDDEWWRQAISRSYYEVMLEGGKRVVLFKDLISNEWFMQQP